MVLFADVSLSLLLTSLFSARCRNVVFDPRVSDSDGAEDAFLDVFDFLHGAFVAGGDKWGGRC